MGGMVAVALLAVVLGAVYQNDNRLDEPRIIGAGTSSTIEGAAPVSGGSTAASVGPIEDFLPKSGEASACREPIGVDLAANFGAKLTINGTVIEPEAMNVNLTPEGEISTVVTASRSLGHYTFRPDDNCPNGPLLRPVGNVLEVCVYRLSDASQRCAVQQKNIFDAL